MLRIPIRRGVHLTLFGRQSQQAVRIRLATYYNPLRVWRIASKRGWMILLVRYDWREPGRYEPPDRADLPLTAEEAWEEAQRLGTELHQAQDALAFVGEMCDLFDRVGRFPGTSDIRAWLRGPQCARQAGLVLPDVTGGNC